MKKKQKNVHHIYNCREQNFWTLAEHNPVAICAGANPCTKLHLTAGPQTYIKYIFIPLITQKCESVQWKNRLYEFCPDLVSVNIFAEISLKCRLILL
jgi:hypothetical protein